MPSLLLTRICYFWYFTFNSGRITISESKGIVQLTRGVDVQCYNYSLPYAFAKVP